MKNVVFLILVLVGFPLGALTLSAAAYLGGEERFSPWVDARGNIHLPARFRAGWVHLGSWSVAGADGEASFHDVYTEPETAAYFREHQEFPDGATLVKEVRSSHAATMTTGRARWAAEPRVWFVMIKDTEGRFRVNPLWGDGWGWALFDAKDTSTAVTSDYTRECRDCHLPARGTDWVYLQGYPTLGLASSTETGPAVAAEMVGVADDPPEGPVVTIRDLAFTPEVIRVRPGQTITWVNGDDFVHTATADDASFDTGTMAPGDTAQIAFDETGTFTYHCAPHPFMKASVIVEE